MTWKPSHEMRELNLTLVQEIRTILDKIESTPGAGSIYTEHDLNSKLRSMVGKLNLAEYYYHKETVRG